MIKRIVSVFLIIFLISFALAGCSLKSNKADESQFTIVTSFYPLYVLTSNITEGADGVSVINMTPSDAGCLHDYQLLPKDLKILQNAHLFIVNGAGMEGFLDKVTNSLKNLEIVTATKDIEFIYDEHNNPNPHTWMYIPNVVSELETIKNSLCIINPENKTIYERNFEEYREKLLNLHENIKSSLSDIENKNIIVSHGTFDYLAKGYGLNIVGTVAGDHNEAPSASQIAELVNIAKKDNVAALFTDDQYDGSIEIISKETGIPVYILNPMTQGDNDSFKNVYEDIILDNMSVIKNALSVRRY